MEQKKISPFVYWAQTDKEVTFKVDIRDVKNPDIDVQDHFISFAAIGMGNHGHTKYSFKLDLMFAVDPEATEKKVTARGVEIKLIKQEIKFWPRLLHENTKPAWLRIDFSKWSHEEDFSDEVRDVIEDYPDLYNKMKAHETGSVLKPESLKKVYLFIYNLWQFIAFLYIVLVLVMRYMKDGMDSIPTAYESVSSMMKLCFLTQFFEVLHPIFGFTKGSVFEPLLQIGGRGTIFFCLIQAEEKMQTKPVIFYLFLVWSFIEIIRYPYYLLRVYNIQLYFVTWLRYTIWIPLYPLGFLLEGVVILRSIPLAEESGNYSVPLPNSMNFSFHFPTLMRIYLLFFFLPIMYKMMMHMYNQRCKKLSANKVKCN